MSRKKEMSNREIAIRKWMLDQRVTVQEIHEETGASKASVTLTIQGDRRDPKVTRYLTKRGCPWELLIWKCETKPKRGRPAKCDPRL